MATFARQQTQHNSAAAGTTTAISMAPSATTSVMVAQVTERNGNSHTNHTCTDNESGGNAWTKIAGHDQELANASARQSVSWWYKVPVTTASFTVTGGSVSGATVALTVHEFTTDTADTWTSAVTPSSADTGTGATSPVSIGATGSVSAGDLLVLGIGSFRHGSTTPTSIAFSGSIANEVVSGPLSNNTFVHALGWYHDTAGGTYSSDMSWATATDAEAAAGIVVLRLGSASSNVEVTPGNATLTTAAQTPIVATPTVVTPGILALVTARQTPIVAATANQFVTPGILELITALQTPTVAATANQNVSPAQLATALTAQIPTVDATSGVTVSPGILGLITALQASSVAFTANQNLTPGILELLLAGQTPEVDATSGLTLVPGNAALVTAVYATIVAATANQDVSPAQLALATTMFAVAVMTPVELSPGIGQLVTARFAPIVTAPLVLVPGPATLVTVRYAPGATGDAVAVWGLVTVLDEPTFRLSLDDVHVWRAQVFDAPAFREHVRDE